MRCIYQKELDKVCFRHDMAYGVYKDLSSRTTSDKVLCDKAFVATGSGYQRGLAAMFCKHFDKNLETLLLTQEQKLFLTINN